MTELVLKGLDGANPLHFLASLGALLVSDDLYPGEATLGWSQEGARYVPRLFVPREGAQWSREIAERVRAMVGEENGALAFAELGAITSCKAEIFREVARAAVRSYREAPWVARQLAGLTSDGCGDKDGLTQNAPISFSNGSSQQYLIKNVRALALKLDGVRVQRSLLGGNPEVFAMTNLNWDPADLRDAAYQWNDPADTKANPKRTDPVANTLAYLGLGLVPTVPTGSGLRAVGYERATGFTWPLWGPLLAPTLVGALLALPFDPTDSEQRRARVARGLLVTLRAGVCNPTGQRNYFSVSRAV